MKRDPPLAGGGFFSQPRRLGARKRSTRACVCLSDRPALPSPGAPESIKDHRVLNKIRIGEGVGDRREDHPGGEGLPPPGSAADALHCRPYCQQRFVLGGARRASFRFRCVLVLTGPFWSCQPFWFSSVLNESEKHRLS